MRTVPPRETELAEALERGDRKRGLELLMQIYGREIHAHCVRTLMDATLAQDVVQQTFEQAFRDLDSFEGKASARSWLYGIATHRCLDALKARNRFRRIITSTDSLPDPPTNDDPTDKIDVPAISLALEECLKELKPQARLAVVLRFEKGFSLVEIGSMCHEKPATVQARVARALRRLHRCLEGKGVQA